MEQRILGSALIVIHPGKIVRAALMLSLLVLAGCAGGLSQSYKQALSVIVPHEVDFDELKYYALRSDSAYDEPSEIRKTYPNVTRVTTVQSIDVQYFIETNKAAGTQTLSIRGTAEKPNMWQDVEAAAVNDTFLDMRVHRGFRNDSVAVFQDVKPYLRKDMDIRVTGHSLGAAIALLVAAYLDKEGYTVTRMVNFGQPKVTADEPSKQLSDRVTRIVDDRDVVPMLPPPGFAQPPYRHVGEEIILRPGKNYVFLDDHDSDRVSIEGFVREFTNFSVKEHHMDNYIANIQGKIDNGSNQVPYLLLGQ